MLVDSLMHAARGVRSARWTITDDLRSRSLQAASSSVDHLSVRCRSTNPNARIPFPGLMPLTTTRVVCALVGMNAVKAACIATVIKSRARRTDTRGSRASTFGLVRRNQFAGPPECGAKRNPSCRQSAQVCSMSRSELDTGRDLLCKAQCGQIMGREWACRPIFRQPTASSKVFPPTA